MRAGGKNQVWEKHLSIQLKVRWQDQHDNPQQSPIEAGAAGL